MNDDEKKSIKKINVDKAKFKTNICIFVSIIGLLIYVEPFIMGIYDFGFIFEFISLILIFLGRICIAQYKEISSKICLIGAIIPIIGLAIYDILNLVLSNSRAIYIFIGTYLYIFSKVLFIINILLMITIIKDLSMANKPEKYKKNTDGVYKKYRDSEND